MMDEKKKILILLTLLLLMASCIPFIDDSPSKKGEKNCLIYMYIPLRDEGYSEKIKIKLFNCIWETVRREHYNREFMNSQWHNIYDEFLPRIQEAKNEEEFYILINEMLMLINSSHTYLYRRDHFLFPFDESTAGISDTGLILKEVEGKVIVTDIRDGSEALDRGVHIGDIILSVDGRSVSTSISKFLILATLGDKGSYADILFEDANGKRRKVGIRRGVFPLDNPYEYKILDNNIGYIKMQSLLGDDEKRFVEMNGILEKLEDTDGLIIDLRGVLGGLPFVYLDYFFEEKIYGLQFLAEYPRKVYKGPLVVLVDNRTRSGQENFAWVIKENGRGIIVGERTCGCDEMSIGEFIGNKYILNIGTGKKVKMWLKNSEEISRVIEGIGIEPDVEVGISIEDIRSGRDPQLDKAIEILTQGGAKEKDEP